MTERETIYNEIKADLSARLEARIETETDGKRTMLFTNQELDEIVSDARARYSAYRGGDLEETIEAAFVDFTEEQE